PDFAEGHGILGDILQGMGKPVEAVASYRRALQIKPDFVEAHCNLAFALHDLRKLEEAASSYRQALKIAPDNAEAHCHLGNVLKDLKQFDDAIISARRALKIKPDFAEGHSNLGEVLLAQGRPDEAAACYRRALEIDPDFGAARSAFLFMLNFLPNQSAADLLAEAQRYGALVARQARPYSDWRGTRDANRRLRVGFVSGDFRHHPVGFFLESALKALADIVTGEWELIAYSNHLSNDVVTDRIKSFFHIWRNVVGLPDETLARRIHDDAIDILIDLSGHTANNRLPVFAWKPAPVQVSWLGYFATTGVAAIDYFVADPWTAPAFEELHFVEKIWKLPETRFIFTPPLENVDVSMLPSLENGYITFGCFNNLSKITDDVVGVWARVLNAIPGSRLFLKAGQLDDMAVRQVMLARFSAHGIDEARIQLEGFTSRSSYLSTYNSVDISLDPFPYSGGATSAESLWMGVPVLTLSGERFISRQGVSLLMNVGLPEWVATDSDDYVARAVSHASDLQRLAALRRQLRQQVRQSPLFEAPRFAMNFKAAIRNMWTTWCDQSQNPESTH
ncbi:MAG TPA: tetratricopeptide repeat protein, partial [Burkholderiaceae bacterium]|nr:tetratricopeptide repeat protein [Burkholderiaceae bacterium]